MKMFLTAILIMGVSGAAFAQAEVPEDTIPGYGVIPSQTAQKMTSVTSELRSEPLVYTVPGYGVETGMSQGVASGDRMGSQTEIGTFEIDYLEQSFPGPN